MKRVLILDSENTVLEDQAIRNVLENIGYIVTTYHIGRPQHYFDIFAEKEKFDYDYLIIGCHGENGKIIVPVLGEEVYYQNECRNNIGFEELQDAVSIKDKTIICTGCTTGSGELHKAFTNSNNSFIAPDGYIEGKSALLFVIKLFYNLSNNMSLKDSFENASKTDSETGLYKLFSK